MGKKKNLQNNKVAELVPKRLEEAKKIRTESTNKK